MLQEKNQVSLEGHLRKERKEWNMSSLPLYFTVHQAVRAKPQPRTVFVPCKWPCLVFPLRKSPDAAPGCVPAARAAAERAHGLCALQRRRGQVHGRRQRLAEVRGGMERAEGAVLPGCPETRCLHRRGSSQSGWRGFLPEIRASSFLIPYTRVEKQKRERKVKRNPYIWTPRSWKFLWLRRPPHLFML